jgi:hypothetical protein
MNSPRSHSSSAMTSGAGRPPIRACQASGELGARVIAPDREVVHVAHGHAGASGQPGAAPVLVEHGHREPAVTRHAMPCRRGRSDQCVRVARVAHHQHVAAVGGVAGDGLPLSGEDPAVDAEQVLALHPLLAWDGTDQQRPVGAAERLVQVGGAHDALEQREGAVLELHSHAVECRQRGRELEQLETNPNVRAEHLPGGDAKEKRVADLARGAGDGHAHERVRHRSPVAAGPRV